MIFPRSPDTWPERAAIRGVTVFVAQMWCIRRMTKLLIESAIRQLRTVSATPVSLESDGDEALVAHAAARILLTLKASRTPTVVEEVLGFAANSLDLPIAEMVKDIKRPTAREITSVAKRLSARPLPETAQHRRLAQLCTILGLDATDLSILASFALLHRGRLLRQLLNVAVLPDRQLTIRTVALISGLGAGEVKQRLARHGQLVGMGLIGDDKDGDYRTGSLLRGVLDLHGDTREDIERFIVPESEDTDLAWADFAHLGALRDLAEQILRAGRPVSILLYGEPGTGKSEFARAIARQIGRGASFAGLVGDEDGEEPKRDERLGHLAMLRRLCATRTDRIVVVDEADDVLSLARDRHASKQFVNRLTEDPKVPTIWIVNDPNNLDRAAVRRMILAISFEQPPQTVRRRITARAAEAAGLSLMPGGVERLAAFPANAAIIAAGVRAASLSGGGVVDAERAVESVLQAMGQRHRPVASPDASYSANLSAADTDLSVLVDRLIAAPSRGWSMLLAGPSGTGKTAFARHLAQRLGIEVEVRRGSDLLGPYVGETEANIAAAFATAARRGAMLLIDEADSFLYRREECQRSWEVTLVNEMLCQMECLETPFVATTNLLDRLDPAAQRRFTLRVAFCVMTPRQAETLFVARFGICWPKGEPLPADQTPGDFAVAAARAELLDETDPRQLARWLREEVEARGDSTRGPVGFCVPTQDSGPSPRLILKEKAARARRNLPARAASACRSRS